MSEIAFLSYITDYQDEIVGLLSEVGLDCYVTSSIKDPILDSVDLILWQDKQEPEDVYNYLHTRCSRVICLEQLAWGRSSQRIYNSDFSKPRQYIKLPQTKEDFVQEDFVTIILWALQRPYV